MFVSLWICKASATAEVATNQASVIGIRRLARKSTLDYSVVVDAPWMTTFYVGIAKNSVHPNAGKLLISLVLSKEGQEILWETSRDGSHHVKGTKYHAWFQKKYADTKFTEFNAETMIKLENQLGAIGKKYRDWLKGK